MVSSARFAVFSAIVASAFLLAPTIGAHAADGSTRLRIAAAQETPSPGAEGESGKNAKPFDVKNLFRNICGFCHEDYGRHAGKGPQLMNSPRSDQYLFNCIKRGKAGLMPAWGSVFNDQQISLIVKFIRSLKPNEEPKNPT